MTTERPEPTNPGTIVEDPTGGLWRKHALKAEPSWQSVDDPDFYTDWADLSKMPLIFHDPGSRGPRTEITVTLAADAEGALLTVEPENTYIIEGPDHLTPDQAHEISTLLHEMTGATFVVLGGGLKVTHAEMFVMPTGDALTQLARALEGPLRTLRVQLERRGVRS